LQAGDYGLPFIEAHSAINNTIRQVMPFVRSYRSFIPSFNTEWGFIIASPCTTKLASPNRFDQLIKERKLKLKYFDGETAASIFSLPKDIRNRLYDEKIVIDDQNLLTIY
jgi:spermidine synthase